MATNRIDHGAITRESASAEGILNPAAARGPDGRLYLFPGLVAAWNDSRIGIARVRCDPAGNPCGVERLGMVLELETDYERSPDGRGGCEDPVITFMERSRQYAMIDTSLAPAGPPQRGGRGYCGP